MLSRKCNIILNLDDITLKSTLDWDLMGIKIKNSEKYTTTSQ